MNKSLSSKLFQVCFEQAFSYDVPYLKRYNNGVDIDKYKLVIMKCVRNKGLEDSSSEVSSKNSINYYKLDNNIIRARSKINELSLCNKWDYFFTGTLDKLKCNRESLTDFQKSFKILISNFNRKYQTHVKFLLIPELHDDNKSWHFHGFLSGIPITALHKFTLDEHLPYKILNKLKNGEDVYSWLVWGRVFGFNDLENIRNSERVSSYITKYITKDLLKSVSDLGSHVYYVSKGLRVAENIPITKDLALEFTSNLKADFENDYCKIYWLKA